MARIRTIKPEFWSSEQIVELSPTARLLFIGLWNFCDDAGNHPASPRTLKMQVFPGDDFSAEQISGFVQEMIASGLLIEYQSDTKTFWHVTGWHHQKIEKPNHKYPPAPGQKFADHSPTIRRPFAPVREKEKEVEKEKERSGSNAHAHEDENSNKKNPPITVTTKPEAQHPPTGGAGGGATVTDIFAVIETHTNTDDGLRELITWKKQAGYSDRTHGPTTGEVTKFITKYLDRIRAGDPVQYFRDNFPAWLVRATEYNRPRKDAKPKYEPPQPHQRQRHNGNAHETTIGDIAGKIITEIAQ